MGCDVYWNQIKEIDRALAVLRKYSIPQLGDAYQQLAGIRFDLLGKMGIKVPRTITQLIRLIGFSPGVIALWHDVEEGFMSEARAAPTAPPIYHIVTDAIAMDILKNEISDSVEEYLMTPDPYLGE